MARKLRCRCTRTSRKRRQPKGFSCHPEERSARCARGSTPRKSMLRVCHLGKYYPPAYGGMESHVATLARAQRRLGAEVTVYCVNHETGDGREVRDTKFRRSQ